MSVQLTEKATTTFEEPKLVNTRIAADILGTQPATLVLWRCMKRYDLPYVKIGRLVLYDLRDLAEFVEGRKVRRVDPAMTVERRSWPRRKNQTKKSHQQDR
jgi:hypothetical protein